MALSQPGTQLHTPPHEVNIPVDLPVVELYDSRRAFDMTNKNGKARVCDFTRTAKAKIRDEVASYLSSVLPSSVNADYIRGELDRIFSYQADYKGFLEEDGQVRSEWLMMQIPDFKDQSVVHVYFDSLSQRTGPLQFTVRVRVGAITQSVTNLPLSSLQVVPYPSNPLGMMHNVFSLLAYNNGAQGLVPLPVISSLPISDFVTFQGFYNV